MKKRIDLDPSSPPLPAPARRRRAPVPEEVLRKLERRLEKSKRGAGANKGTKLKAATRGEKVVGYIPPDTYDLLRLTCTLESCTIGYFLTEAVEEALKRRELARQRVHRDTSARRHS